MAGQQYLNTISENATRLGMRLQETLSEHTRDLAIGRGSGAGYLEAGVLGDEKTPAMIRKQLDSSSDREKLDAMKRLVAVSVPFAVHTQPKHPFYLLVYRLPAQIASY